MTEKFVLDGPVNALGELINLLDYNQFDYKRLPDGARLVFCDGGRKWETVCVCKGPRVLIYGVFPWEVTQDQALFALLNELNGRLVSGGLFISQKRVVMRTCADLFDCYNAYETIGRALEYNAGAVAHFFKRLGR